MLAERLKEIFADSPWIPDDCRRVLAKVRAGQRRYGVEWFDGPQRPAAVLGPSAAASFPSAQWIGRCSGQPVGYESVESDRPVLCRWGGSQRQVVRRYTGIDDLILAQLDPASDRRPVLRHELRIHGMAFGPWHDAGMHLTSECILSPGLEIAALESLLTRMTDGWRLVLQRGDSDNWLCARRRDGEFELLDARHGCIGEWRTSSRTSAFSELLALAPYNDGALGQSFARLDVPKPA